VKLIAEDILRTMAGPICWMQNSDIGLAPLVVCPVPKMRTAPAQPRPAGPDRAASAYWGGFLWAGPGFRPGPTLCIIRIVNNVSYGGTQWPTFPQFSLQHNILKLLCCGLGRSQHNGNRFIEIYHN